MHPTIKVVALFNDKINYDNMNDTENLSFYSIQFNVDQINNLQYPTDGFLYNFLPRTTFFFRNSDKKAFNK